MGRWDVLFFNDTHVEIRIWWNMYNSYTLQAGETYTFKHDRNFTYREIRLQSSLDNFTSDLSPLDPDDFIDFKAFTLKIRTPDNFIYWEAIPRGKSSPHHVQDRDDQVETALKTVKEKLSPKFNAALRSCMDLKKLSKGVKICQKQCNHLVRTCVEGIQKMTELYSRVAEDAYQIWRLYNDGTVTQLSNPLARIECIVSDVKVLLRACAKELSRIALVISMPMSSEKNMEVCSMFDLLLGELMWNLDLIEHLLQPTGSVKLEWCSTMRRYVLKRGNGSRNVVAEKKLAETKSDTCEDVRSLAHIDRKDLQSGLENGSIFIPDTNNTLGRFAWALFKREKSILNDIISKRCKVDMHFNQNPSMSNSRSLSVDPECFKIDHLDLKPKRLLRRGSYKETYEGEWCGLSVAIAIFRGNFGFEDLENEVKQLLGLQHPKVVSLFGWAYTNDAPVPIRELQGKLEDVEEHKVGGYIVTEKMECDLEYLIKKTKKDATKKDSGGPFSYSVGLDILLQIVEAMLHVQKHSIMHRDLKPGNFLVNSKSVSQSGADKYYDVKLIDFGSSKLCGEDKNTYNKGTSHYGAPEMQVGKDRDGECGEYGPSVDVFSFAMTCYEVITGDEPYTRNTTVAEIRSGKRPEFPLTISIGLKELMEDCWAGYPNSRPTFEEIQNRLWSIKKDVETGSKSTPSN